MTEAELRALDGRSLTRLAFSLGLAPIGVQWDEEWFPQVAQPCWDEHGILSPESRPWHPHENLAQADELFRSLRTRGFGTKNEYYNYHDAMGWSGHVQVSPRVHDDDHMWRVFYGTNRTEAHAQTLCVILAIALSQETS